MVPPAAGAGRLRARPARDGDSDRALDSCRARSSSRSSSSSRSACWSSTSFAHWSVARAALHRHGELLPADPRLDLLDGRHQHRDLRGRRNLHPGPDRRRGRHDPRAADPRLAALPGDPLHARRHLRGGLRADLRQRLQRELRPPQLRRGGRSGSPGATGSSTCTRRAARRRRHLRLQRRLLHDPHHDRDRRHPARHPRGGGGRRREPPPAAGLGSCSRCCAT